MPHTTQIVESRLLSNGQISVCIRCCGDKSTDHWHDMAVEVASDPEKRKASLDPQRQFVANQHEHATKAAESIVGELGIPQEHP
jgi:hypothetical protein